MFRVQEFMNIMTIFFFHCKIVYAVECLHGIKGFVIPSKSFFKIGITKIFCYNKKCLVLSTKRLVAAAKFLAAATKNLFAVPSFVAVKNKKKIHFFSVQVVCWKCFHSHGMMATSPIIAFAKRIKNEDVNK